MRCSQRRQGRCVSGCSSRTRGSRRRREQKSGSDLHFWTPNTCSKRKKEKKSRIFVKYSLYEKKRSHRRFWLVELCSVCVEFSESQIVPVVPLVILPLSFEFRLWCFYIVFHIFELNADHFSISLHKFGFFPPPFSILNILRVRLNSCAPKMLSFIVKCWMFLLNWCGENQHLQDLVHPRPAFDCTRSHRNFQMIALVSQRQNYNRINVKYVIM